MEHLQQALNILWESPAAMFTLFIVFASIVVNLTTWLAGKPWVTPEP